MSIFVGLKGQTQWMVDESMSAANVRSGSLSVFSTPHLVALMENAAVEAISDMLKAGETTVGTGISVKHLSATPMGMLVYAQAELTQYDGRALHFHITAHDEAGPIGEAEHTRFIVDSARFMQRAETKRI